MIRLTREWDVSYVSPAHSEILILPMEYLPWAKVTLIKKIGKVMYKKSLLYVGSTVGSKNKSKNQFYSLGWNKLILHYKYGGGGRI